MAFIDLVDNLEKVGDHLANIAQGIVGEMRWRMDSEQQVIAEKFVKGFDEKHTPQPE